MGYRVFGNSKMLWTAFLVIICTGVAGVLVDLDHIPFILGLSGTPRLLHLYIAIASWIVLFCSLSYLLGLLCKCLLRKLREL